ncbi:hypothetical protein GCM10009535_23620 [Streptomyces thermocarboxydovorans]|uniref:Uncharacterized protein n=1 Tax=Streptomyces thermocarboxydovorans TaxID=59298 RepID=A0ABN1HFT5_9ACTN
MAGMRCPILAVVDFPLLPGTVLRPLVDPVPLSPVPLVWRKGLIHPALADLRRAAAEPACAEGWLEAPGEGWLPAVDRVVMASP